MVIASVILSWLQNDPNIRKIKGLVDSFVDPIMQPFYRLTGNRLIVNGIDFTPVLVIIALNYLNRALFYLMIYG